MCTFLWWAAGLIVGVLGLEIGFLRHDSVAIFGLGLAGAAACGWMGAAALYH